MQCLVAISADEEPILTITSSWNTIGWELPEGAVILAHSDWDRDGGHTIRVSRALPASRDFWMKTPTILSDPSIVKLFQVIDTEEPLFLVMEHVSNQE